MLINSLSLKNFKCFEEVAIDFAPITLLTGANSSGKSSLIYSILATLQTEQFPFYLSPNGKYINLGSFEELIYNNSLEREFSINFEHDNETTRYIKIETFWRENKTSGLPILNGLSLNIGNNWLISINEKDNAFFLNLTVYLTKDIRIDYKNKDNYFNFIQLFDEKLEIYTLEVTNQKFETIEEIIHNLLNFRWDFNDEIFSIQNDIEEAFNYCGSFRIPPERTYYQKAKVPNKINVNGEGYIDQILEWEETNNPKLKHLLDIMSDLQLFFELKSNKLKGGRFELAVKTSSNSKMASLTDVGFGVSQFLPIIVADLQLNDNSLLAISQPEIHLHPKIQAKLGDYLASQIKNTEKQYIVETHSEYLLNRIRLLLVKGELKPKDVKVYYMENDGNKTITHQIEFLTDGQIKNAPASFFDTYGIDVMEIAMNSFAETE